MTELRALCKRGRRKKITPGLGYLQSPANPSPELRGRKHERQLVRSCCGPVPPTHEWVKSQSREVADGRLVTQPAFEDQSFLFQEHSLDSYSPQINRKLKILGLASNKETLLKWFLILCRCRPPKGPNILLGPATQNKSTMKCHLTPIRMANIYIYGISSWILLCI